MWRSASTVTQHALLERVGQALRVLSIGVMASPVVPTTTIGPAPAPVISQRPVGRAGQNVQ